MSERRLGCSWSIVLHAVRCEITYYLHKKKHPQFSLYHDSDVYMKGNVQAHQGQVTNLKVSASVSTESADSIGSVDRLISYGTDCVVRIWKLVHKEYGCVSIQQLARVKLLQTPRDLAMAGNTLCMAMADNNVIMCRLGSVFA